jgi:O-antigen ligase
MSILCAILLGLAIVVTQVLHGGLMIAGLSSPAFALLAIAAVPAVVEAVRNRVFPGVGAIVAVCILLGYLAWRCLHAPDVYLGRIDLELVAACGVAFLIGAVGLGSLRAKYVFLGIIGIAAICQAIFGFLQFAKAGNLVPLEWFSMDLKSIYETRFPERARGLFLNPNQFAWLMGWAALFSISLACWGRVSVIFRVLLIYFALMFIAADVLSASRGGLASLVVGLAMFALMSVAVILMAMRRGKVLTVVGVLVLLGVCLGSGYWTYTSNWVTQGRVDALQEQDVRPIFYAEAFREFQTSPLLGAGSESFRYAARLYRTGRSQAESNDPIYTHSDWLQMLGEFGLVGFGLALIALLVLLGGGMQKFFTVVRDRTASDSRPFTTSGAINLGAFCATAAFAIHSIVDFNMHVTANTLLGAATLGLLAAGTPVRVSPESRVTGILVRAMAACLVVVFGIGMGLLTWRHGLADWRDLRAKNDLAGGHVKAAIAQVDAGLALDPDNAGLLATRGRALYGLESALQFKHAAELTPGQRHKVYQQAAEAYRAALVREPMEREYHMALGKALAELPEEGEAARMEFIKGVGLDPMQQYVYGAIGDYFDQTGDFERALRYFEIGSTLPMDQYCGARAQDVRDELNPPADDGDASAPGQTHDATNGGEGK